LQEVEEIENPNNFREENEISGDGDKYLPSCSDFNILNDIHILMSSKAFNETFFNTRDDGYNISLYEGSTTTVKEFNDKFLHILRMHHANPEMITSIYETLMEEMPFLNIPFYLSRGNKKISIVNNEIDVHKYPDSIHVLTYDCCKAGCMVYTDGVTKICKNDNCLVRERFKPCIRCPTANNQNCNHSNRIPHKQFKYRSIKLLLTELLKFQSFRDLIKCKFYRQDESKTYDISDRESYEQFEDEMHIRYRNYCKNVNKEETEVTEVSIISSWFEDAIQLFGKELCNFRPIMISIDNLPPSLRDKIGIGTFILTFMQFKEHSGVEEFFYNKCFLPELLDLFEGFAFDIDGKHYFLQLRILGHIADLKGLCNWLKLQTMQNSHSGCMICNNGKGKTVWLTESSHIVKYIDSRLPLPEESFLRSFGLSRNCCPKPKEQDNENNKEIEKANNSNNKRQKLNYSNNNNNNNNNNNSNKEIKKANNSNNKKNQVDIDILDLCIDTNDKSRRRRILEFLSERNPDFIWFSDFLPTHFKDHLYYNHCEYRPMSSYKDFRTDDIIKLIEEKKIHPRISNGVLGMSFVFYLPYFNYALHISVEPKHALKDFLFDFVFKQLWKNSERFITDNVYYYYEECKTTADVKSIFPLLLESEYPKCSFLDVEQKSCELILRCLLIPRGCGNKLKFADFKIFDHSAFISIDNVMTIFTTYMHLLLMCSHWMSNVYKLYYRILSDIICRINAPSQYIKNIEPLYWRTVEFRALTEGLFPVTVMTFMLHSLTCLAKQIMKKGPLSSWNGLYGETNVASVKRLVKVTGGSKYEQMAYKKQFNKEAETMKEFYENFDINDNEYSLFLDKTKNIICYHPEQNNISVKSNSKYKLTEYEFGQLSFFIMKKIRDRYHNNDDDCLINSSYYRVIKFIEKKLNKGESRYKCFHRYYYNIYLIESAFIRENLTDLIKETTTDNGSNIQAITDDFILYIYNNRNSDEMIYDCLMRLNKKLSSNENTKIRNKKRYINYIKHLISIPASKETLNGYSHFDKDMSLEDYYTFNQIFTMRNNLSIVESSETIIKGIKFYCRGFQFSEKVQCDIKLPNDPTPNDPTNVNNNLSENWSNSNQFSAWCKISDDVYGQLNYFFKPPIPNDNFVRDLHIASVTRRRALVPDYNTTNENTVPPINCIDLTEHKINNKMITRTGWNHTDEPFIEFNDILPTRVATVGLHKNGNDIIPIYCSQYNTNSQIEDLKKLIRENKISSVEGHRKIDFLGLIDVSPENLVKEEDQRIQDMINRISKLRKT